MDGIISTLVLGVAASLIAALLGAGISYCYRNVFNKREVMDESYAYDSEVGFDTETRVVRRENVQFFISYFFSCVLSAYLVYGAMILPPTIASFGKTVIRLSDAKFIGWIMPDLIVGEGFFQLPFIAILLAIYPVCWALVGGIYRLVYPIFNYYYDVDRYREVRIKLAIYSLLSAGIAVLSTWLFVQPTLKDSLMAISVFGFIAFLFVGSQNK